MSDLTKNLADAMWNAGIDYAESRGFEITGQHFPLPGGGVAFVVRVADHEGKALQQTVEDVELIVRLFARGEQA